MKLFIKQKVFSWTDSYNISDEQGNICYTVKAEWLSFGHQLHVYDAAGVEVGRVSEKIWTWMPAFEIEIGGQPMGRVRREFTWFKPRYQVDYHGWRVEGDVFGWEYAVYSGQQQTARIYKELFTWGDSYVVEVDAPEDALMALMLVIAIDAANCNE